MKDYILLVTMGLCFGTSMAQDQKLTKEPTAEYLYEKGLTLVEIENLKKANLNVRDYSDALYWLRNAADMGSCNALKKIGDIHLLYIKWGNWEDYQRGKEALYWFEKAYKCGNVEAISQIMTMYNLGWGVKEDKGKTFEYAKLGANMGNPDCMCTLGSLYYDGKGGADQDFSLAFKWYLKAAELGYELAQVFMADNCCRLGLGTDKNEQKAFEWVEKAAQHGNSYGQYRLGMYYLNGIGTQKNIEKGKLWLIKSAKQGYPDAVETLKQLGVELNHYSIDE